MLAAAIAGREPVDQHLRRVAADRRGDGRARRRADAAGEQRARVRVLPREHVDDGDRVDRASSDRRALAVGVGGAGRVGEQVDRLERGGRVVDALLGLADADEHRGAGIKGMGGTLPTADALTPASASASLVVEVGIRRGRPRRHAGRRALRADRAVPAVAADLGARRRRGTRARRPRPGSRPR